MAVVILAFGVLGLAGTTAFVVRQVTMSDLNTERSAAFQSVIERLRASPSAIGTGSQTIGSFAVTWSVTDSTALSKTVRVITSGPGLSKDTTHSLPRLTSNVLDTFTMMVLR